MAETNVKEMLQCMRKPVENTADLQHLFRKTCTNVLPAANNEGNVMHYRHPDLDALAKAAFEAGSTVFYANPKYKSQPNGPQVAAKPHYEYKLTRSLSEAEYELLISALTKTGDGE